LVKSLFSLTPAKSFQYVNDRLSLVDPVSTDSIRKGEEMTLEAFAKLLGVSRQHLCDIEKGRRRVSPERAAKWARVLGYSETTMVQLALQYMVEEAGLKMKVSVKAA
jgi:transcriptional regulator with XRE-family HTH domain